MDSEKETADLVLEDDKRVTGERRKSADRRKRTAEESGYTGPERRSQVVDRRTGLERRRGAGIRRSEDRRSAEEGEMSEEQFEFLQAVQTYKKVNKRLYPTWSEVLEIVLQLGYRKVEPRTIKLEGVPEAKFYQRGARDVQPDAEDVDAAEDADDDLDAEAA